MTIQFINAWNGYDENAIYTLSAPEETRLIAAGLARNYVAGLTDRPSSVPGAQQVIDSSRNISAADDGLQLACVAAVTLTIPAGLSPRPSFIVVPPPAGVVSLAVSGGALINGAATTITRARSSNVAVVVIGNPDADTYGVSGS